MTTKIYFDVFCKDSISFPGCAILQILLTQQVLHVETNLKEKKIIKNIPLSPILYFILKNNQSLANISSVIINNLLMYHTLQW